VAQKQGGHQRERKTSIDLTAFRGREVKQGPLVRMTPVNASKPGEDGNGTRSQKRGGMSTIEEEVRSTDASDAGGKKLGPRAVVRVNKLGSVNQIL